MKFTSVMAVLAAALCVAGCRYDKSGKGSGSGDNGAEGMDIANGIGSDEGALSSLSESKFEDMFEKCTDVDFAPVYFAFDSAVMPEGEIGKADAVANHLSNKPERVVVIEGNCDERGSNEYNMSLGTSRAIIVRDYLVQSGIAESRIQVRSYGEEKPAVEGQGEAVWSQNRRDEFGIYDTSKRK